MSLFDTMDDDEVAIIMTRAEAEMLEAYMVNVDDDYVVHNKIRAALGWEPLAYDTDGEASNDVAFHTAIQDGDEETVEEYIRDAMNS
jgi:hypothetical protein